MSLVHKAIILIPSKFDPLEVATADRDGQPLSRVFDVSWDFSGTENGSMLSAPVVSFSSVDETYREDIQIALLCIIKAYKKENLKFPGYRKVDNWKQGLVYIRIVLGNNDWASLSDDKVYSKFKVNLKKFIQENNFSSDSGSRVARAINKLNSYGMCFRIPNSKEFKNFSIRETEQAIAIPIGMYQPLIAKAIETVEKYHHYRTHISVLQNTIEELFLQEANRDGASSDASAICYRVKKRMSPYLNTVPCYRATRDAKDLNNIIKACITVVLAFSGMRVSEMSSLSKFSYEEKGTTKIPILKGEETKRNGSSVQEVWQTHPIVKEALELVYDATQYGRNIYTERNNQKLLKGEITKQQYDRAVKQISSAFLPTKLSQVTTSYVSTNSQVFLKQYIKDLNIVATHEDVIEFDRLNPSRIGQLEVGKTLPKLTPHDFRRTFAVFFKRYGFGSSATIKFQYKHRNINMSDYYSNNARLQAMNDVLLDNDLLELMNEEGVNVGIDIFDDIYNKSENLSGLGGERIAKDKFQRLGSGQHVYMSRAEIETLVRNGTLSAVKLPTGGYCLNSTCSRVCGFGQFAAEINPCEHQVVTDKEAKVILKQNIRLSKTFRDLNSGDPMMSSILIATKQKIKRNEQLLKRHDIDFVEFNERIKSSINILEV